MKLSMSIQEVNEVNKMRFEGISIMDCSIYDLKKICVESLQRFDNYQQLSEDQGKNEILDFFVDSYNELEEVFFHLKEGGLLSLKTRNEIRMLIKETEKHASSELYM